jgi:hypothetical protein
LVAFVGSTWAEDDYMSSYCGIDPANAAASGLDEFNADEGFKDVNFGGALSYRFLERWRMAALGTYARLLGDAEDSPVVDDVGDANQFFGGASMGSPRTPCCRQTAKRLPHSALACTAGPCSAKWPAGILTSGGYDGSESQPVHSGLLELHELDEHGSRGRPCVSMGHAMKGVP